MSRVPSLLVAGALAAACAQDDAARPGDFATTFDTIGGIVHVTNTGSPPPARLVPVVSIGPKTLTDTGSPDEFGGVTSVALGPDGDVYVADGRNFEVRVFGLDGAHRRTFGREGEGPGEFQALSSLAWAGDLLLTMDPMLGRVASGRERASGSVSAGRGVSSRVGRALDFTPSAPTNCTSRGWVPRTKRASAPRSGRCTWA